MIYSDPRRAALTLIESGGLSLKISGISTAYGVEKPMPGSWMPSSTTSLS